MPFQYTKRACDVDAIVKLGHVLVDAQRDSETLKELKKFGMMLEDHKKLLYSDCKQGFKKLCITLEMLQQKAANGITDKGFEELLGIVKNMLPERNELTPITYEAKKGCLPSWIGGIENTHMS